MHSMDDAQNDERCCFYICYMLLGPLLLANGISLAIMSGGQGVLAIVLLCISVPSTCIGGLHIIRRKCACTLPPAEPVVEQGEIQPIEVARPPGVDCAICAENPREIAYIPCGHTICIRCNQKLIDQPCSFCRAPIYDRLRLY